MEALRPFVQYYWVVRWDLRGRPAHLQRVLPNLSVHVSFSRAASGVWAPSREVFSHLLEDRDQVLGARFRPGCFRSFARRPMSEFSGRVVSLAEVFGPQARETEDELLAAAEPAEMARLADELLGKDVPALSAAEEQARDAVRVVASDPGMTRVAALAEATGLSARTLQRLFATCVGVSPKWAIRVHRLDDAARRIADDPGLNHADLAHELGYSDQAHFVRDFTTVVGTPPARYARAQAAEPRT
ncbi:AraC family transcriptional regulator [Prauserella sp. ASG 168]|uniref:AraC family transcriptional regulator n=2 Tax=Prauserella cavernicola TaxID=2800127 RepID=A0A934V615_9PSEU|nr:AraC family transcriptional regulator [Prauserella cavernicola]